MSEPVLLRVPQQLHTVEEVLACAGKMGLENVLVLSEREDGAFVMLNNGLSLAQTNWILDKAKMIMLVPSAFALKE